MFLFVNVNLCEISKHNTSVSSSYLTSHLIITMNPNLILLIDQHLTLFSSLQLYSLIYTWYIDTLDWPANNQANLGGPVKDYDIINK